MAFNPLDEKGIPMEQQIHKWSDLNVEPSISSPSSMC